MALTNTANRYGTVTKVFHWLTALLILTNLILAQIGEALSPETQLALKAQVYSLHKTVGVAVFFVALARILWALTQPKPGPLHPDRRAETYLAELVHWHLYGALVLVPLTGWIYHAATEGFAPILWPFSQNLPGLIENAGIAALFKTAHHLFAKVLVVSLLLHVAGALKHVFVDRDATLRRMWFGQIEAGTTSDTAHRSPALIALAVYVVGAIAAFALTEPQAETTTPTAQAAGAGNWAVESGEIGFTANQFGKPVDGSFANWQADISFDEATGTGEVRVEIDITSLSLGSVTKDALAPAYFDAEAHPTALFEADIAPEGDGFTATGTLSLAGEAAGVALPFALTIEDDTATMSGEVTLMRQTFGIGGSDEGTVGFEVPVRINLTATRAG
ncbi:cytochrome b/b6 domain-containing protein [Palleronia caenipelagi]|uniref:Cytochrome n=1 Tax=Palleronia caenipelagi TaxID=2489174 RepID=A0A547Q027_9RHOB|nr:cytochrome b/b6 domain-containing protein [Palleronia caenipelagi]TRD19752.1 cytochrome [Palleronia caenipelagi]